MKILVMNAGSSSQKSSLYELTGDRLPDHPPSPLWEGQIDWSHQPGQADITVKTHTGETVNRVVASESRATDTSQLLETLWSGSTAVVQRPQEIDVVGHRVVHGGQEYQCSVVITPAVKATIERLFDLAPIHNPANLAGIHSVEQILGADILQVATFDTAFHSQMPAAAATYPGPHAWVEQGIRRYGFHGISHEYCAHRAAQLLGKPVEALNLITCHLGNGCSLAAVQNGRSIDTTMGFTPLEGLMMGTRSGSVDPGILLYLMRHQGYSADELDRLLNKESGLQGISGLSGDMRQIHAAIAQDNPRAQLAFEIYIHRLRSAIGSMLASLGGVDALVFTAGVGEHDAQLRALTCEAFQFLGLRLDLDRNGRSPQDTDIATAESTVRVLVIHTQEDWAIAQQSWHCYRESKGYRESKAPATT